MSSCCSLPAPSWLAKGRIANHLHLLATPYIVVSTLARNLSPPFPFPFATPSRTQLTPAAGLKFGPSVKLAKIIALPEEQKDAVLRDLAIAISTHGVVFFEDQNELEPEDLGRIALRLGELAGKPESSTLHIHPTQNLTETGLPLGKIDSQPDKEGRQISFADSGLTSKGWHSDVAFEPKPALYTILKMHTLPKTGGE